MSDFVGAALFAQRQKEIELDKNEEQKKKDAEKAALKAQKKSGFKEEAKIRQDDDIEQDTNNGFTMIEDRTKKNTT